MSGVNKVILIGRLGKDPEKKQTRDGKEFSRFSLATSRKVKDHEVTQWHNVTCWSESNARYVNDYCIKGTMIYIEGEIEYRTYDKDGVTMYATDIIVPSYGGTVQMVKDGRPRDEGNERRNREPGYREASGGRAAKPAPEGPLDWERELDDELPPF